MINRTITYRQPILALVSGCLTLVYFCHGHAEDSSAAILSNVRTVATSDQPINVRSSIPIGGSFLYTVLNNNGNVAFITYTAQRRFLWAERNGQLVSRISPEPEGDEIFFTDAEELFLTGNSGVPEGRFLKERIWKWSASGLTQLAGPSLPAADESGSALSNFVYFDAALSSVHSSGSLIFEGTAHTPGVEFPEIAGFWIGNGQSNGNRLLFLFGDQVPGAAEGITFGHLDAPPKINAQGNFIIGVRLSGPANLERRALVTNSSGALEVMYRQGDQVPGKPDGVVFLNFGSPAINDKSDSVFTAATGTGSFMASGELFRERNGQLESIASSGQSVLDTQANWTLAGMEDPVINAEGLVAFRGALNDPTQSDAIHGIFIEDSGKGIRAIVTDGSSVPGGPPEAQFFVQDWNTNFQLNRLGQVVVGTQFRTEDDPTIKLGLFVDDPILGFIPIALPGDLIQVKPGDIRQIAVAGISNRPTGNQDGTQMTLNERGQILFLARFTDGTSGLFVSNAVAVPESRTAFLAVAAILAMLIPNSRWSASWKCGG